MDKISFLKAYLHRSCYFLVFASLNSRKEFFISSGLSCELNVQRIQGMAILIMPNYNMTSLPWH